MDKEKVETGLEFLPKFNQDGLIVVVTIQNSDRKVLMLAYANKEAIKLTLETGQAHYYSRSRQQIWHKGATSGHFQKIISVSIDCDQDALIYKVKPTPVNCHRGYHSCFYRTLNYKNGKITLLQKKD